MILYGILIPSGNQTWRAKSSIYFSSYSQLNLHFLGDFLLNNSTKSSFFITICHSFPVNIPSKKGGNHRHSSNAPGHPQAMTPASIAKLQTAKHCLEPLPKDGQFTGNPPWTYEKCWISMDFYGFLSCWTNQTRRSVISPTVRVVFLIASSPKDWPDMALRLPWRTQWIGLWFLDLWI